MTLSPSGETRTAPLVRKIALTGGIATGKSLAGDYLRSRGVPVIDADEVVHRLLSEDEPLKREIREAFGEAVFSPDGTVNRPALAAKIFDDPATRRHLENLIHPQVRTWIARFYEENRDARAGVAMIPLLFESDLAESYDEVWLLDAPEAIRVARLLNFRGMSREDALARIHAQMDADEKRRRTGRHPCGRIFSNSGSPADLYAQIDDALSHI